MFVLLRSPGNVRDCAGGADRPLGALVSKGNSLPLTSHGAGLFHQCHRYLLPCIVVMCVHLWFSQLGIQLLEDRTDLNKILYF